MSFERRYRLGGAAATTRLWIDDWPARQVPTGSAVKVDIVAPRLCVALARHLQTTS